MRCPKCGIELPDIAKFCHNCGPIVTSVNGGMHDSIATHSAGAGSVYAPSTSINVGSGEKRYCPSCQTPITDNNRSIRCFECSTLFCAACELDFRSERQKGEKPLCHICYEKHLESLRYQEKNKRSVRAEHNIDIQDTEKSAKMMTNPDEFPCPGCGTMISHDALMCYNCKTPIEQGEKCSADTEIDDVINVSGHRMGTAEVESSLVSHPAVAESAVVGYPHDIKSHGIYAYVTLKNGYEYTDDLKKELQRHVRNEIGPIAQPDVIHWAPSLPKTRSGKIMRSILRNIAANEIDKIGDTSTLVDSSVVQNLIDSRHRYAK